MSTYREPTPEEAVALFKAVEDKFPKGLGEDKWYIVAVTALLGSEPDLVGPLYTYIINKPEYQTSESRKALIRRIREVLFKNISIQGICKPLHALLAICKLERPEDQDLSFSREDWNSGDESIARGKGFLGLIYQHHLPAIMAKFSAHKDFTWVEEDIIYGLYLSDHTILNAIETELVVLPGIMIQNLPLETSWHLRGARRVGISKDDVELVQQCVEMVAKATGVGLHKIGRVADIEHEV